MTLSLPSSRRWVYVASLRRLLQSLVIVFLLGVIILPLGSASAQTEPPAGPSQEIPDSYQLVAENNTFQLFVDKATLGFKVSDKRNGYIWNATLDEKADADKLNKSWLAFAQSGVSIEYLDPKAVNKRVSITNSTTTLDVQTIDRGVTATVAFTEYGITLGMTIQLDDNGVSIDIPFDSIKQENPDFKLGLIYVYPFMGAVRGVSIPGYMFIPDGSGSLIRFGTETKAKNMFYGRYYGADIGMLTYLPYDSSINSPMEISIPVMGMVHGGKQNAFLTIVEKGASYGELQAHPAGIITNFNFLNNVFVYNQSYFQATNRSGAGVTTIQRNTNKFDVKMRYRFLAGDSADYVGMARDYQKYLVDKGVLKKSADGQGDIGIKLEFLGGDKEKVLFWHRLIPMTTVRQMDDMLTDLNIKNVDVVYYGWQPLGAGTMPPRSLKVDGGLGTLDQLQALAERIRSDGGNFYLYYDPQSAIDRESGYSTRNDLAMSITNANLLGYNRGKLNYYFNLDALSERYSALSQAVFSKPGLGLALDTLGWTVYSDFKKNHFLSREQAIVEYQGLLTRNQGPTAFYAPNDYLYAFTRAYYNMPLGDNGYVFTSESVPFLEIVLAGYVPYYGPALNFSSNVQDDLLRQVDYGVYPSYFLTEEVTAKILNTSSEWIYTSSRAQWLDEIKQKYQWMNSLLAPVKGQEIVARETLSRNVVATTYANGWRIIVNYGDTPFRVGDVTVKAKDAVLVEGVP